MILVTGGLGFIGAHVVRALLDRGEQVVATRHRRGDIPAFLQPELDDRLFVEPLDVTDAAALRALLQRRKVRSLVHLAVSPIGATSFAKDFAANIGGLVTVLQAAHEEGLRRASVASSIGVYLSLPHGPFHEDQLLPLASKIPTEAFKKSEEILGADFAARSGLDLRFLRLANIFGPLYRSMVNVPSRIVHAAVKGVPGPLPHPAVPEIFADAGNDFCYVKDAAEGIAAVHLGDGLRYAVYNIGSGGVTTPRSMLDAVRSVLPDARAEFHEGSNLPAEHYMDISRLLRDTAYRPRYDTAGAIADYVAWLRAGNEI